MKSEKQKIEEKWQHFKKDAADKAAGVIYWAQSYPELAIVVAGGVFAVARGALKFGAKVLSRANQEAMQREIRRRCYDPSEGHYWFLKRDLSNEEWLLVNRRHLNGERLGDILFDLKVLK